MLITTRTVATVKPLPQRQEIPDVYLPGLYLVVERAARGRGRSATAAMANHESIRLALSPNRPEGRPRARWRGIARGRRGRDPRKREGADSVDACRHGRGGRRTIRRVALPPLEPAAHHRRNRSACSTCMCCRGGVKAAPGITRRDVLELLDASSRADVRSRPIVR